jgi:hypothetical protein
MLPPALFEHGAFRRRLSESLAAVAGGSLRSGSDVRERLLQTERDWHALVTRMARYAVRDSLMRILAYKLADVAADRLQIEQRTLLHALTHANPYGDGLREDVQLAGLTAVTDCFWGLIRALGASADVVGAYLSDPALSGGRSDRFVPLPEVLRFVDASGLLETIAPQLANLRSAVPGVDAERVGAFSNLLRMALASAILETRLMFVFGEEWTPGLLPMGPVGYGVLGVPPREPAAVIGPMR